MPAVLPSLSSGERVLTCRCLGHGQSGIRFLDFIEWIVETTAMFRCSTCQIEWVCNEHLNAWGDHGQ
jgi:hypothetical protein